MSPDKKKQRDELLAWAATKLADAQAQGIYGTVTFMIEGGVIVRSETKTSEKPKSEKL